MHQCTKGKSKMARMMDAKLLPKPNVSPGVLQKLEEEDVKDALLLE